MASPIPATVAVARPTFILPLLTPCLHVGTLTPDHRTRNASLRDALLYLQRCTFIRPVSELVRDLVELKLVESRYNKMPCDVDFKSSTRCSLLFARAP